MKNTVELLQVRKTFDHFVAVDDLSLAIPAGSVFGLLGPNGAGKTSSIRMMIGITVPDSGEVRIFGQTFHRKQLTNIGYLPEERGLYKKMKIIDQLVFLAELKGVSPRNARARAGSWCERFELTEWMQKKVEELSRGMQQKVQFIAAMLHDPDLLILDEPFSGLDPANTVVMKDVLLEAKKAGKTILFSTHRMDTVERLCDSICLIDHGKAVLQGDLREVKSRYGRNNVQVEYEGQDGFLNDPELVQSFNNYGKYVEIRLQPGADPQKLLHKAAAACRINKFELMEPSLEEIFIDVVGKSEVPEAARRANA
jgi:ABC-2 type transport system ATP-binding protein